MAMLYTTHLGGDMIRSSVLFFIVFISGCNDQPKVPVHPIPEVRVLDSEIKIVHLTLD